MFSLFENFEKLSLQVIKNKFFHNKSLLFIEDFNFHFFFLKEEFYSIWECFNIQSLQNTFLSIFLFESFLF